MVTPTAAAPELLAETSESSLLAPAAPWRASTRVLFRFCFVYFGLYVLVTQMLPGLVAIPGLHFGPLDRLAPIRGTVLWTARHLFHLNDVLVTLTGSGDRTFDWVQSACLLAIAAAATIVWSYLGRRRTNEAQLSRWFRVFIRFALGSTLLGYGFAKVLPLQMPAPSLIRLLEPFGHFSPMGVLWTSVGASRWYEMFTGLAEATGGMLLFVPRTATLGALIALADMTEVFTLNMTYDVPVKLFSLHLMLLALFLLAPEAQRLANVLMLGRAAGPSAHVAVARGRRANRIALVAQVVFGVWLLSMNANVARIRWTASNRVPMPVLYGIWDVQEMSVDGAVKAPLLTDSTRWRRVVFDRFGVAFQRMNERFVQYIPIVNVSDSTIRLAVPRDTSTKGRLTFRRPTARDLMLDGEMDGHTVHLGLVAVDIPLLSRGFHWIQERPFNR